MRTAFNGAIRVAALMAAGVTGAHAAEWSIAPSFAVAVDEDTNRTLATDAIASQGLSMSADMRLRRATERFDLWLLPQLHIQRFSDRRFDRSDDAGLTSEGTWLTERSTFDVSSLIRDQSTLTSELFSTGIFDLNTRRRDERLNASWAFAYAEHRVFSLTSGFQSSNYHGNSTTSLQDSKYSTFGASERFIVSERLSFSLDASAGKYVTPDAAFATRSDSLSVGFMRRLSERTRVTGEFGVNRRTDRFSSTNGFVGQLSIARSTETGGFSLSAGRNVAPSGFGIFTQTDQAQLAVSRGLAPRWNLNASLSVYRTSSAFQSFNLADRTYSQLNVALTWQANEYWSIGTTAGADRAVSNTGLPASGWHLGLQSVWRPMPNSLSR